MPLREGRGHGSTLVKIRNVYFYSNEKMGENCAPPPPPPPDLLLPWVNPGIFERGAYHGETVTPALEAQVLHYKKNSRK